MIWQLQADVLLWLPTDQVYIYTNLGLNIDKPDETIPILESTSALFKSLFNLDAYPLALNRKLVTSIDDYILIADNLSPTYKVHKIIIKIDHRASRCRKI